MKQQDQIYKEVTESIVNALKNGVKPWASAYDLVPLQIQLRSIGIQYQGVNFVKLVLESYERQYRSPYWFTFLQLKEFEGDIKGQKGTRIIMHKKTSYKDKETGEDRESSFTKAYTVFNGDQIKNLPEEYKPPLPQRDNKQSSVIDKFIKSLNINIETGPGYPRYLPKSDKIIMPDINLFQSTEHYNQTLLHECVHLSGNVHRLNRDTLVNNKDTAKYNEDELIAELGSSYLMASLGLRPLIEEDSAPYLNHYIKALKKDPKYIWEVSKKAQEATEYLLNLSNASHKNKAA